MTTRQSTTVGLALVLACAGCGLVTRFDDYQFVEPVTVTAQHLDGAASPTWDGAAEDAGEVVEADAGTPPAEDAGDVAPDAGGEGSNPDAGAPLVDGGPAAVDAGSAVVDGGADPGDGGSPGCGSVGAPCSDGLYCTIADSCDGTGRCVGAPRACDDGNPATLDSCDEAGDRCAHS